MKFSIRDLFLVTAIVALVVAWWVDHWRMATERKAVQTSEQLWARKMGHSTFSRLSSVGRGALGG